MLRIIVLMTFWVWYSMEPSGFSLICIFNQLKWYWDTRMPSKGRFLVEKKCHYIFIFHAPVIYFELLKFKSYFPILLLQDKRAIGPKTIHFHIIWWVSKHWVHFSSQLNLVSTLWYYIYRYTNSRHLRPIWFNSFCKVFSASIQLSIRFRPCVSWGGEWGCKRTPTAWMRARQ